MPTLERYDMDGKLLEHIDNRTLEEAQQERIDLLKSQGKRDILQAVPDYKQISAALGLYPEEKLEQIKSSMANALKQIDEIEAQILRTKTNLEADSILIELDI